MGKGKSSLMCDEVLPIWVSTADRSQSGKPMETDGKNLSVCAPLHSTLMVLFLNSFWRSLNSCSQMDGWFSNDLCEVMQGVVKLSSATSDQ